MPKSKKDPKMDRESGERKKKKQKLSRVTVNVRKAKDRVDTMFIAYDNDTLPEFLKRYKKELGDLETFNVILKEGNDDKVIKGFDFSGKKEVHFTLKTKRKKKSDSDVE